MSTAHDNAGDFKGKQGPKGDLVDVCATSGLELRRRPRGRGRSLAGRISQENGDSVLLVGNHGQNKSTAPITDSVANEIDTCATLLAGASIHWCM